MNRAEKRRQKKIAEKAEKKSKSAQSSNLSFEQQTLILQQAITNHNAGRLPEAENLYRQVLQINPNHPTALHNLGLVAHQVGKNDLAVVLIRQSLAIEPDSAEAYCNLAVALKKLNKLEEAVDTYNKAIAVDPDFALAHNNLGIALTILKNLEEAVNSYKKALAINPDYAEAHNNLGNTLIKLNRLDEAIEHYHKAIEIKPAFIEAHNNLCAILDKTNNIEPLREAIENARKNCPGDPLLAITEAQLLKRDRDYSKARDILIEAGDEGIDAHLLGRRAHLLGDLCDRLGDNEAAFGYFKEGNQYDRETPEAKLADGRGYLAQFDSFAKRFTPNWIESWRDLTKSDDRSNPVFLVGFPRSGTTLLDSILRSHPAICVVEEKPAINNVRHALKQLPGGDPDGLAELNSEHLAEVRQIYFAELDKHLNPEDHSKIVVDKMPLNILNVGHIQRIFPQAKFLFALRHPCDCVLSCFMQSFKVNHAMANFLDLKDAACLYDQTMSLWQHYQAVFPLDVHTVCYENLVESFEDTLDPLFDFLGVDWDDAVMNYSATARQRGIINTPSYNQVTQPIYKRARGRWERYREQMEPVLPTLMSWAKHFGYK